MSKETKWHASDDQIVATLLPFGVHPSGEQLAQIREYIVVLLKWNRLISLTTVTDPNEIVARHFGESIFLKSVLPVENGRLADVGSGAGFPGLALKIVCPELHVVLIESNKKKAAFLSEVVRTLNLSGVEVLPTRFEDMRPETEPVNFVTARALGSFAELLRWSKTALEHRGHIALWIGGEDATKVSNTMGWTWSPAVRIPESQRRFIIVGQPAEKVKQTDIE
jgi:16S rRNA (guanine527-N7)-methyltransferase